MRKGRGESTEGFEWKPQRLSESERASRELNDAFEAVGIVVRAKINRLCNDLRHDEAIKLERALTLINTTDYSH